MTAKLIRGGGAVVGVEPGPARAGTVVGVAAVEDGTSVAGEPLAALPAEVAEVAGVARPLEADDPEQPARINPATTRALTSQAEATALFDVVGGPA